MQSHLLSMLAHPCTTVTAPLPSPSEPQPQSGHQGDHYQGEEKGEGEGEGEGGKIRAVRHKQTANGHQCRSNLL